MLTRDMTTGNPIRIIVAFGLPLLAGNILQQLYNMVDTIVVGKGINVDALAAVGATGSINFLVLGFVLGLMQGVTILVAQYFGAKEYQKLRQSITMSAYVALSLGLIVSIVATIFSRELLQFMDTPVNILDDAVAYIQIIFAGTFIVFLYNFFSGILRAVGDSRNPLVAMIISFFINVVLDVLFVIYFKMGVAGAAYATVAAQAVSSVYCYICVRKIPEVQVSKADWKFNTYLFKRSFKLSLPVALMNSVTAVGVMVLQYFVNSYGSMTVAGYTAGSKIIMILEQVGATFGAAIATFVGQNLGANKLDRIKEGVNKTALFAIVLNGSIAAVMILFGKAILQMMVDASEVAVIDIAYEYVVITSLGLWVLALLFVYRGSLQAMGDTIIPMISGVIEFFARIVTAMTLPAMLGFVGIGVSEVSAWVGAAVLLGFAFYYRLKQIQLEHNRMLVSDIQIH